MASTFDVAAPGPARSPLSIRFPEAPRGTDEVPTNYSTVFTWNYGVERPDLRQLYEKSKDAMWNVRTDLAWQTNVDPEEATMPDQMSPIWGTPLWDKLDKKT